MSMSMVARGDERYFVFIIAVWCASILVVNPVGDFPLLDDWSFGQTVAHLLETGEYRPWRGRGLMTLFTNVLWGALFCLPAGFSFTALRVSSLVAALVALLGMYVLIRDLQQPRQVALIVVLLLAFNPLFYMLSHSFMTEALFVALLVWASVFFIRSLSSDSNDQLLVATVLALAATLSRQLALCLPLAFAATSLLQSQKSLRSVLLALIPLGVCLAGYFAIHSLAPTQADIAEASVLRTLSDAQLLIRVVLTNLLSVLIHLGLFLLPILLIEMCNLWRAHANRFIKATSIATLIVLLVVTANAHYGNQILLPWPGDFLMRSGVGSTLLRDAFILKLDNLAPLPTEFWVAVTMLALAGAVMLSTALGLYMWRLVSAYVADTSLAKNCLIASFALLTIGFYVSFLVLSENFYDKYVVPMIPFMATAIICLGKKPPWCSVDRPQPLRWATYTLLFVFSAYAVMGTRDFLEWNRVRWTALRELMQDRDIGPEDIDGGFEFNGLYLYDPRMTARSSDVSWWWVHRDRYLIAFGPVRGYAVIKEYTYQHWLPWHTQRLVVLRKL